MDKRYFTIWVWKAFRTDITHGNSLQTAAFGCLVGAQILWFPMAVYRCRWYYKAKHTVWRMVLCNVVVYADGIDLCLLWYLYTAKTQSSERLCNNHKTLWTTQHFSTHLNRNMMKLQVLVKRCLNGKNDDRLRCILGIFMPIRRCLFREKRPLKKPAWVCNHMHSKVWDKTTTAEVWEWRSNFIPYMEP